MKKINSWFNDFFGTELKTWQSTAVLIAYAAVMVWAGLYLYLNQIPK